tara:strand:- start:4124 stop:4441 length:318 start_codon:yes stop_codon:yes gene_type:complete
MNKFFTIWEDEPEDPLGEYSALSGGQEYEPDNDEQNRDILNKIIIKTFQPLYMRQIPDSQYRLCLNCDSYTSNHCGSCIGCYHAYCEFKKHKHPKKKHKCGCILL